ncbi:hypothetical protein SUGI_1044420 [Cryptomeria japonica]|uniref:adenine DNA glycosylase isoform X2 n=1 Tax=Cryptomeria japonica TaxID=3369 RepID=UPI00241480A3|nr:adenine DNA glycosylase isoform X2 [Cryptomeria japonica]GLJ49369.1 hypothetical protein SUGI_1044420 [Cryptomeria japonica]
MADPPLLPLTQPPFSRTNKKKKGGINNLASTCNTSPPSPPKLNKGRRATPKSEPKETPVVADIEDFKRKEASSISQRLLEWYYATHRVLPWRSDQKQDDEHDTEEERDRRAYEVWVSEVMLHQTRVTVVVDYYTRWMDSWPTLHHLAKASQEEVNEMWAGLGYYRRARYLLEGAKEIVENQGGVFPRTLEGLKKVPGIGDYTAGAIASIAFKQGVPVVDGNVIRVVCRLKAISANPKLPTTIKRLWELAGQLVDPKRPGDLNQAIMELGATICTPTSPACSSCPVAKHCNALSTVRRYDSKNEQKSLLTVKNAANVVTVPSVTDYPVKVLKAIAREEFAAVCVIELSSEYKTESIQDINSDGNSFLLVKRPEKGLLAGLWEFPSILVSKSSLSPIELKAAMDQYLESSLGIVIAPGKSEVILRKSVGKYIHVFSHIRLHMYIEWMLVHMPAYKDGLPKIKDLNDTVLKWVDTKTIQSMGLTSGVRKVYVMLQEFKNGTGKSESVPRGKKRKKKNILFIEDC